MIKILIAVIKVTFYYLLLIVLIRILGKREVGQLSIFDLVVLLLIADIAVLGLEKLEAYDYITLIFLIMIVILQRLFSIICLKSNKIRKLVEGRPVVLVINGEICYESLQKQMYNVSDLLLQLRTSGCLVISDVLIAILETNGQLSVFKRSDNNELVLPVVESGEILLENLALLKIDDEILLRMLAKIHKNYKEELLVFSNGKTLIIPHEYHMHNISYSKLK